MIHGTLYVLVDCFVVMIASHPSRLVEAIFQSLVETFTFFSSVEAAAQMWLSNIKLKDPLVSISFFDTNTFSHINVSPSLSLLRVRTVFIKCVFQTEWIWKPIGNLFTLVVDPNNNLINFKPFVERCFVIRLLCFLLLSISVIGVHLLLYPLLLHMFNTCYCPWCWTISEWIQVLRYSHRSLIGDFANAFSVVSSFHRL